MTMTYLAKKLTLMKSIWSKFYILELNFYNLKNLNKNLKW
jgi:hypothetical protein